MDFPAEVLRRAGVADEQRRLLVPGFDMANHDFRWAFVMVLDCRRFVEAPHRLFVKGHSLSTGARLAGKGQTHTVLEDGQVALMTSRDYAEGEEVCIFYERAAPWLL